MSSSSSSQPRLPTVVYDAERSSLQSSADDLAPPDISNIIQTRKHPWKRFIRDFELPRRVQLVLTCISIALCALQSNGVYCWPTYGPVVARLMDLDGAEAQTIVVGGILGVYLMAAPLGTLSDRYGPRVASAVSALLGGAGYLAFSILLTKQSPTPTIPHIHLYLTASFFLVGAATVGSYFACLTTASLSFPSHPTLALSIPLSLTGLSSLFLSSFSTIPYFQTDTSSIPLEAQTSSHTSQPELNAPKFLFFLAILCPTINIFSALFMRVLPPAPIALQEDTDSIEEEERAYDDELLSRSLQLDERTPLLIGGIEAAREEVEAMERGKNVKWTAMGLVKDWEGFWVFGLLLALTIGPAETAISSIGSILTSLLPPSTKTPSNLSTLLTTASTPFSITASPVNALALRNKHVSILALCSTLARLLVGITADILAPPLTAIPAPSSTRRYTEDPETDDEAIKPATHIWVRRKKVRLTRSAYTAICAVLLAGVFAWSAGMLDSERGLWVLSGGTGSFYGALFTLLPAIVSAHFGPTNFGLAWGMVSYFAAVGAVGSSYLYALLSVAVAQQSQDPFSTMKHDDSASICYGPRCFRPYLWTSAACCLVGGVGMALIGRRWKV